MLAPLAGKHDKAIAASILAPSRRLIDPGKASINPPSNTIGIFYHGGARSPTGVSDEIASVGRHGGGSQILGL
jgi:hypothetical protein